MCKDKKDKKDKKEGISPEKLAILAERGLKAAKLTKEEKQYLLRAGLGEFYDVCVFTEQNIPPLASEAVEGIVEKFLSKQPKLWIRIGRKIIEIVGLPKDWNMGSPAFAHRGEEAKDITFHKKAGKLTLHLKIMQRDERLADIHVLLTDDSGKDLSSFEVELLKGERCIETVSTSKNNAASLSAIELGDYLIRISDSKGEITSLPLRMEQ